MAESVVPPQLQQQKAALEASVVTDHQTFLVKFQKLWSEYHQHGQALFASLQPSTKSTVNLCIGKSASILAALSNSQWSLDLDTFCQQFGPEMLTSWRFALALREFSGSQKVSWREACSLIVAAQSARRMGKHRRIPSLWKPSDVTHAQKAASALQWHDPGAGDSSDQITQRRGRGRKRKAPPMSLVNGGDDDDDDDDDDETTNVELSADQHNAQSSRAGGLFPADPHPGAEAGRPMLGSATSQRGLVPQTIQAPQREAHSRNSSSSRRQTNKRARTLSPPQALCARPPVVRRTTPSIARAPGLPAISEERSESGLKTGVVDSPLWLDPELGASRVQDVHGGKFHPDVEMARNGHDEDGDADHDDNDANADVAQTAGAAMATTAMATAMAKAQKEKNNEDDDQDQDQDEPEGPRGKTPADDQAEAEEAAQVAPARAAPAAAAHAPSELRDFQLGDVPIEQEHPKQASRSLSSSSSLQLAPSPAAAPMSLVTPPESIDLPDDDDDDAGAAPVHSIPLDTSELDCLRPNGWLTGAVLHRVLRSLAVGDCDVVLLDLPLLRGQARRRPPRSNSIFVPICIDRHYILFHVQVDLRTVTVYDSMNTGAGTSAQISTVLSALALNSSPDDSWQRKRAETMPHQLNHADCGVYVLITVLHLIARLPLPQTYDSLLWRVLFAILLRGTPYQSLLVAQFIEKHRQTSAMAKQLATRSETLRKAIELICFLKCRATDQQSDVGSQGAALEQSVADCQRCLDTFTPDSTSATELATVGMLAQTLEERRKKLLHVRLLLDRQQGQITAIDTLLQCAHCLSAELVEKALSLRQINARLSSEFNLLKDYFASREVN
ncbi:hypothetical protein MBLNU459_g5548t2 [Dothideomycetes sp. NU459]